MKKHKFIVEIEIPKEANITEIPKGVTITAMRTYFSNILHSDSDINSNSIKVVHATRAKAAELLEELKLN